MSKLTASISMVSLVKTFPFDAIRWISSNNLLSSLITQNKMFSLSLLPFICSKIIFWVIKNLSKLLDGIHRIASNGNVFSFSFRSDSEGNESHVTISFKLLMRPRAFEGDLASGIWMRLERNTSTVLMSC